MSGKKHRDAAAEELEREAAKAAGDEKENLAEQTAESQDMLGDKDNEDVIF